MPFRFSRVLLAAAVLVWGVLPAKADEATPGRPLISDRIDERQLVRLEGNTRPEVATAADRRAIADDLKLNDIHLQLRRSPAQERAVAAYVDSLTEPGSPHYHHWMTATEFGRRFGVAQPDITRVTDWLKAKGMTVNFVYPSRMVIDFSATAGQIRHAFHTEIDRLDVDGVSHIANIDDPEIPAALAPVVEGVVSLHDFRAHNKIRRKPDSTGSCDGLTCYAVAPGDLAAIYGLKDLFAAGFTGRGEVIAAVEDTNLYRVSDWATFRNIFGLAKYTTGNLRTVQPAAIGKAPCANPGILPANDAEATLDAEWASAAAPGATILIASCADGKTTDGIYLAIQNLVNGDARPAVISVSYGICEVEDGAAQNAAFLHLYQQAVAEGISVFVATGDSGPTGCARSRAGTPTGIGINAWSATPYNVAVGGTDFRDTYDGNNARYWTPNKGAPWTTAKSYVPEIPWNDTCASALIATYYGGADVSYGPKGFCNRTAGASFRGLGGGEGGPSECFTGKPSIDKVVSGTCKGNPKPAWQTGLLGMPSDGVRDTPDVALFASDGSVWSHNYVLCFSDPRGGGPCTGNPASWMANSGGVSFATPIMAAIQAVIDQREGKHLGNPLPVYYKLAKAEYGKGGSADCAADKGNKIGAGCVFHDIVSGDNAADCTGAHDCYRPGGTYGVLSTVSASYQPAFKAGVGYDLTTGIGSVNAYNLAKHWPK